MNRRSANGAAPPRRIYRYPWPFPELTDKEAEAGWPAYLCGGILQAELGHPTLQGMNGPPMTLEEVEAIGGHVVAPGDGEWCDEEDELVSSTMEAPRLDWMVQARSRGRGRPRKCETSETSTAGGCVDDRPHPGRREDEYQLEDEYRRAIVSSCERELRARYPVIDLDTVKKVCELARDRSKVRPIEPQGKGDEGSHLSAASVWMPERATFSDMCAWAFVFNLPRNLRPREIRVRAVEFVVVGMAGEWGDGRLSSSRHLALASFAAMEASGEAFAYHGNKDQARRTGWAVEDAIKAEESAIGYTVRKLAKLQGPCR